MAIKINDLLLSQKLVCLGVGQTFFDAMEYFPINFDFYVDSDQKKGVIKFNNHKLKIVETKKFLNSIKNPKKQSIIVFTPNFIGLKNILKDHGFIHGRNLFYFLDFEEFHEVFPKICREKEYYFLAKILCMEDVCIDAGANVGLYTHRMSILTGGIKKNIFAFEPIKENFEQLLYHLKLFELSNVEPVNLALANKDDIELEMVMPIENGVPLTGHSFVSSNLLSPHKNLELKNNETVEYKTYHVNSTTIDNYIQKLGINKLQFIKIDVEGSEINVLEGAKISLAAFRPIIQVELVSTNKNYNRVLRFLKKLGYEMFYVSDSLKLINYDNIERVNEKNFVFIHSTKVNYYL